MDILATEKKQGSLKSNLQNFSFGMSGAMTRISWDVTSIWRHTWRNTLHCHPNCSFFILRVCCYDGDFVTCDVIMTSYTTKYASLQRKLHFYHFACLLLWRVFRDMWRQHDVTCHEIRFIAPHMQNEKKYNFWSFSFANKLIVFAFSLTPTLSATLARTQQRNRFWQKKHQTVP